MPPPPAVKNAYGLYGRFTKMPAPPKPKPREVSGNGQDQSTVANPCFIHGKLDEAGLSPAGFRVLCHLFRRQGKNGAYPSADSMSEICRLEKKTVFRALRELEERHFIVRTARPGRPTVYALQAMATWVPTGRPKRHPGWPTDRQVGCQTGRGSTQKAPHEVYPISISKEVNPEEVDLDLELEVPAVGKKDSKTKSVSQMPTTDSQKRFSQIMGRRLTTAWSPKELAAFKALGPLDESDLESVEAFYRDNQSNEKAYLRTSLSTLLNNFPGEVDRARTWERTTTNRPAAHNQPIKF